MKRFGLCALGMVLISGCSGGAKTPQQTGSALPPTPEMVRSSPKGLNTAYGPDKPATFTKADMPAVPAPDVDVVMAPSNEKPDTETRLANLEAQLASLRADYDKIVPTFKSLTVNSDRLASLLDRLEAQHPPMNAVEPAAGPALSADELIPADVTGLRFGVHPDKTRIVIDLTTLTQYSYDLDNQENVMLITLPAAGWKAGAMKSPPSSPLIQSWSYQALPDGGAALLIQLKQPVKVTGRNALPAAGTDDPRIYIDISPL